MKNDSASLQIYVRKKAEERLIKSFKSPPDGSILSCEKQTVKYPSLKIALKSKLSVGAEVFVLRLLFFFEKVL